jgi:pimeloyl-ACP methyl ester carboxylesterase
MLTMESTTREGFGASVLAPPPVRSAQHVVRSTDGIQLNVRAWGEGDPRYFLVHGFGDCSGSWGRFARRLSITGAAAAIDLRGHGDSERDPEGTYDPLHYFDDVTSALRALDLSGIVLVGHSMGAAIAIHVATRCADRVRALVLVDGGPYIRRTALTRVRAGFVSQPWNYRTVEEYSLRLETKLRHASPSLLHEVARSSMSPNACGGWTLKCDPDLARGPAYIDDEALSRTLSRVSCPVLLIRGAASAALSRTAAGKLLGEIPNGRLQCVPNAGHAVMLDNPDGLAACVSAFADELVESPS